jgi:hypothetical protein
VGGTRAYLNATTKILILIEQKFHLDIMKDIGLKPVHISVNMYHDDMYGIRLYEFPF